MLDKLSRQIIWKLKQLGTLSYDSAVNRWEEFCWNYQGESFGLKLWDDYITAQISLALDKLTQKQKLEAWLHTEAGSDFIINRFDAIIDIKYLNIRELACEIPYCEDDVNDEIFDLIKSCASDYELSD